MRAIATNLIRAELQHYAREQAGRMNYARVRMLEQEMAEDDETHAAEVEFFQEFLQAVAAGQTELLHLKYCEDLSIETIATGRQHRKRLHRPQRCEKYIHQRTGMVGRIQ